MTYINLQYGKTKAVIQTQGAQIASFRGTDGLGAACPGAFSGMRIGPGRADPD